MGKGRRKGIRGDHVLTVVPPYLKVLLQVKAIDENRTVSQLIRHFIMVCMKPELDAAGYGEVDFSGGGIVVSRGDQRGTVEVKAPKIGPSDDPIVNSVENFMALPGED